MLSTQAFEVPAAQIAKATKGKSKRTAVAGAETSVVQESVRNAQEAGLIEPVLIGDEAAIRNMAKQIDWDISSFEIINTGSEQDTSTKAVALARSGDAEVLMKGAVHTDALMRAVVDKENGLRTEQRMSHIFQMTFPGIEQALYVTDAALNVAPNVSQRIDITQNAVSAMVKFGVSKPKVAILSAVEIASPAVPSSMDAAEIAGLAMSGSIENAIVEGPLSMDLAVSPEAAKVKGLKSKVVGQADLIVVPTIETGNTLFKTLVYFRSATAAGLVLGAKVPIVLTSRADPPEARLTSCALAMML